MIDLPVHLTRRTRSFSEWVRRALSLVTLRLLTVALHQWSTQARMAIIFRCIWWCLHMRNVSTERSAGQRPTLVNTDLATVLTLVPKQVGSMVATTAHPLHL